MIVGGKGSYLWIDFEISDDFEGSQQEQVFETFSSFSKAMQPLGLADC
jgi:hypothetical protein